MGNYYSKKDGYTLEEISTHNKVGDAWIAIDGYVYNFSSFTHPGGQPFIVKLYGTNASNIFHKIAFHGSHHKKKIKDYIIGKVITPTKE